eukprot:scaffold3808_cov112-Isochrysis_galbana.AAC.21
MGAADRDTTAVRRATGENACDANRKMPSEPTAYNAEAARLGPILSILAAAHQSSDGNCEHWSRDEMTRK